MEDRHGYPPKMAITCNLRIQSNNYKLGVINIDDHNKSSKF